MGRSVVSAPLDDADAVIVDSLCKRIHCLDGSCVPPTTITRIDPMGRPGPGTRVRRTHPVRVKNDQTKPSARMAANPPGSWLKNPPNEANCLIARSQNSRTFATELTKRTQLSDRMFRKRRRPSPAWRGAHAFSVQPTTLNKSVHPENSRDSPALSLAPVPDGQRTESFDDGVQSSRLSQASLLQRQPSIRLAGAAKSVNEGAEDR